MRLYFILLLFGLTSIVNADVLGFRVSGGLWSYEVTGDIRDSANASDNFSLKDDFGISDTEEFQGFVYFEHPVPIIPNIRFGTTSLKLNGNGTTRGVLGTSREWNGTTIPNAINILSDVDLSHTELAFYYEIIDVGLDLDLGLNFKFFDGRVALRDGLTNGATVNATSEFKETIPMIYGHLGIPLVAGFSLAGDISFINYDGDDFSDILLSVRWESDFLLGVEVGYRSFAIDYEDGNEIADVEIKGPYASVRLAF